MAVRLSVLVVAACAALASCATVEQDASGLKVRSKAEYRKMPCDELFAERDRWNEAGKAAPEALWDVIYGGLW